MPNRIPPDAFEHYYSLGPERSYQKVAEHYQVSKRAVTKLAAKERWQERVLDIERKSTEGATQKTIETVEAMKLRHLKTARFVQAKGVEALKGLSLDSAMDAVRALDIGIKQERLIRGEPTERSEVSIQDAIRQAYEELMVEEPEEEDQNEPA